MVFYKIVLKSFPKIKYAHTTRTDKYKNVITYRRNMLELNVSSGRIQVQEGDRTM